MKKNVCLLSIMLMLFSCNNQITTSPSNNPSIVTSSLTSTNKPTSNVQTTQKVTSNSSWEDGRTLLECGYYQMDLPKNHNNPYNLKTTLSQDTSSWSNNDLKEYLPNGFRYIYKNACDDGPSYHKASAKFYSSNNNAPGGLKIDNTGVGFQSQMFKHTGEKLEIRIGISQVNNASDKPEKEKDPFHIYFFDNEGKYLSKHVIEKGAITVNTKEISFYYTNNASKIAYFEFRSNAMPFKGEQCYNVGISYCNFKSWERV